MDKNKKLAHLNHNTEKSSTSARVLLRLIVLKNLEMIDHHNHPNVGTEHGHYFILCIRKTSVKFVVKACNRFGNQFAMANVFYFFLRR